MTKTVKLAMFQEFYIQFKRVVLPFFKTKRVQIFKQMTKVAYTATFVFNFFFDIF